MSSKVPEIIACTDKNDIEGVKKCIEKGCNIDEQRQVILYPFTLFSRMDDLRFLLHVLRDILTL